MKRRQKEEADAADEAERARLAKDHPHHRDLQLESSRSVSGCHKGLILQDMHMPPPRADSSKGPKPVEKQK